MARYNVSFFKTLLNSAGRTFKCGQRVIAVDANRPDEALNAAKQEFEHHYSIADWRLYADTVEMNECEIKTPAAAPAPAPKSRTLRKRVNEQRERIDGFEVWDRTRFVHRHPPVPPQGAIDQDKSRAANTAKRP